MNEQVKELIRSVVKPNGAGLINGQNLQDVLIEMVDSTVPATSSYATEAGKVSCKFKLTGSGINTEYDGSEDITASLENYPDREEVTGKINDATSSVQDWVRQQHYLTSASLSGSITEEVVVMKINDATASVKEWVEEQGYATTESLTQLSESVNTLSSSVAEDFANLNIPDISGLATTSSVNELSESVAQDFANLEIPDVSGLATTSSVLEVSASVKTWVEEQGYLTEHQDISGLATTQSLNEFSESVSASFADIDAPDLSIYATTASVEESIGEATQSVQTWVTNQHYLTSASLSGSITEEVVVMKINEATASVEQWVEEQGYLTEHQDISGLATTASVTSLSESVAETIENLPQVDISGYATTSSVTASINEATQSVKTWVGEQGYLTEHQDISGLATTASVNELSSSVAEDLKNIDLSEYATTSSLLQVSSSLSASIAAVTGSSADLSGYATTSSLESDTDGNNSILKLLQSWGWSYYDPEEGRWFVSIPTEGDGTLDGNNGGAIIKLLRDLGLIRVEEVEESEEQSAGWWVEEGLTSLDWENNPVGQFLDYLSNGELAYWDAEGLHWNSSIVGQVAELSASVASIVVPDLSTYATTASVNNVSESVFNLSSSVASDFENLDIPDISGLATTASLNQVSSSLSASIAAITGSGGGDLSIYATTASLNQVSESVAGDISSINEQLGGFVDEAMASSIADGQVTTGLSDVGLIYTDPGTGDEYRIPAATSQSVYNISASFDQRINNITGSGGGGTDTDLRRFLFGVESQDIGQISSSVTNIYSPIIVSSQDSLGFVKIPEEGQTIAITVYNGWTDGLNLKLPASVVEGNITYPLVNNGVAASSSLYIKNGNYGEITVTRKNNVLYVRTSADISQYITSASLEERLQHVSDTDLRSFLFGVENQTITGITGSVTNVVSSISSDATLGFNAVPDEGASLGIIIHNTGSNTATVSLPATVSIDNTTYTLVNNGVVNSGSFDIPTDQYGDIVVTRIGTNLYLRTSVDLSNIEVDLSGYATTSSVNDLSSSVSTLSSSVNDLSASFDTRINEVSGSGGGGGSYLPLAGGTITGDLKVNGKMAVGAASVAGSQGLAVGSSNTRAGGNYCLAVGENCQTNVYGGFVAGRENVVEGDGAFGAATGFRCRAIAMSAYAGGCRSTGSANFSTAIGFGAEAKALGQVVLGSYNAYDPAGSRESTGSYAVILGIGKSSTWNQDNPGTITRENGLAIKWNGDIDINYSGSIVALQAKIAELEARLAALEG